MPKFGSLHLRMDGDWAYRLEWLLSGGNPRVVAEIVSWMVATNASRGGCAAFMECRGTWMVVFWCDELAAGATFGLWLLGNVDARGAAVVPASETQRLLKLSRHLGGGEVGHV